MWYCCVPRRERPSSRRCCAGTASRWDVPIYTVCTDMETAETAKEILVTLDYLSFSSAGGVERYFAVHGTVPEKTVCVCIGKVTATALRARYEKPFLTAASISAGGIAETIFKHRSFSCGDM